MYGTCGFYGVAELCMVRVGSTGWLSCVWYVWVLRGGCVVYGTCGFYGVAELCMVRVGSTGWLCCVWYVFALYSLLQADLFTPGRPACTLQFTPGRPVLSNTILICLGNIQYDFFNTAITASRMFAHKYPPLFRARLSSTELRQLGKCAVNKYA